MKRFAFVFGAAAFAPALALAQAAAPDLAAGKAKAEQVCAACHGANGVSVSATVPNLAGQKQAYLASQLTAFKSGARKNAVMNAIAAQITPADIANTAAFYAGLQGAAKSGNTSSMFPTLLNTRVKLPEDYQKKYTLYQTVNYPERPQVRHLYANDVALKAAKEGKPTPNGAIFVLDVFTPKLDAAGKAVAGKDGNLEPDKLLFTSVMEKQAGWGKDIPDLLKNGDWNYGIFNADKTPRGAANLAECFACHKPLDREDYLFSFKPLREFAAKK